MFNGLIFKWFTCVKEGFTMHKGFTIEEKVHKKRCGKFQEFWEFGILGIWESAETIRGTNDPRYIKIMKHLPCA